MRLKIAVSVVRSRPWAPFLSFLAPSHTTSYETRKRNIRWLAVVLIAFSAEVAQADALVKRKPGLWELRWYSNDVKPSESPLKQNPARMCIDATTDEKLAALYDACDPPLSFAFYSPQFTWELVCEVASADFKSISRAKITFAGDTAYRIEVRTRLEPALKSEGEYSGGREGKWLGACPADMRPGDLIVGDEPKINILEELAKPAQ